MYVSDQTAFESTRGLRGGWGHRGCRTSTSNQRRTGRGKEILKKKLPAMQDAIAHTRLSPGCSGWPTRAGQRAFSLWRCPGRGCPGRVSGPFFSPPTHPTRLSSQLPAPPSAPTARPQHAHSIWPRTYIHMYMCTEYITPYYVGTLVTRTPYYERNAVFVAGLRGGSRGFRTATAETTLTFV